MAYILNLFNFIKSLKPQKLMIYILSVIAFYLYFTRSVLSKRYEAVIVERDNLVLDNQLLRRAFSENQAMLIHYIQEIDLNSSQLDAEIKRLTHLDQSDQIKPSKVFNSTANESNLYESNVAVEIQAAANLLIQNNQRDNK